MSDNDKDKKQETTQPPSTEPPTDTPATSPVRVDTISESTFTKGEDSDFGDRKVNDE